MYLEFCANLYRLGVKCRLCTAPENIRRTTGKEEESLLSPSLLSPGLSSLLPFVSDLPLSLQVPRPGKDLTLVS